MATATERRRRRVLDNSEERLQKILGIRSNHSSSLSTKKSSVSEVDGAGTAEDVKDHSAFNNPRSTSTGLSQTDGDCREEMDSACVEKPEGTAEIHSSQRRAEYTQSSNTSDSSTPTSNVPQLESGTVPNKWIRPVLNTLLAALLIARWTYLNFENLTVDGVGKSKSAGATMEQANESIIWPFLTLQLVLLCVPQLRQTTHSPRISMLTVALQLSGIPVKLTNCFNLILSSLVTALSDFGYFIFAVVLLYELVTNVAPIL